MLNRKKVFVTGGRGRLATIIHKYLDSSKYEVTLFSRNPSDDYEDIEKLYDSEYLKNADYLLHLSWSNFPATSQNLKKIWSGCDDYIILQKLISSSEKNPRVKFVFFSSGAVYGNTEGAFSKNEMSECVPLSWYGQSKLFAERMVQCLPNYLNLRISNPYGKISVNGINYQQGIIPKIIKCAMNNEPLEIWGDGSALKDFLYYTDFISGLDKSLEADLKGIYNLCQNKVVKINEIILLVESLINNIKIIYHPIDNKWDVVDNRISNAKLCRDSDWIPKIDVDSEGIVNTIREIKLFF